MKNQQHNDNQQITTENKMGTMPVGKLLIQISLPIMISMFVQALYNIVDSIFVAKLSTDALTAVSLAFPIQNLMISAGVGTGVGINALLSMRLGQKDNKAVNQTALKCFSCDYHNCSIYYFGINNSTRIFKITNFKYADCRTWN